MKKQAQKLQKQGRNGDTILAHINPEEALLLKSLGGAGSKNPKTGLMEFFEFGGGDDDEEGSFSDSANTQDNDPSNDRGDNGPQNAGQNTFGENGAFNSLDDLTANNFNDFVDQYNDYQDSNNSLLDDIGNFFAGLVGFNERAPEWGTGPNASWGFDPVTGLASLAGVGLGVPGVGLAADFISEQVGRPAEVALGPDVFGGAPSASSFGLGFAEAPPTSYEGDGLVGGITGRNQEQVSQQGDGYNSNSLSQPPASSSAPAVDLAAPVDPSQSSFTPQPAGQYYRGQGLLDTAPENFDNFDGYLRQYYASQALDPQWFSGPFSLQGYSRL